MGSVGRVVGGNQLRQHKMECKEQHFPQLTHPTQCLFRNNLTYTPTTAQYPLIPTHHRNMFTLLPSQPALNTVWPDQLVQVSHLQCLLQQSLL